MNGHDTDPTPPHGTERPPTRFSGRVTIQVDEFTAPTLAEADAMVARLVDALATATEDTPTLGWGEVDWQTVEEHDTDPTPTSDLREHLRGYFAGRFSVPDPDAITTQVLDALDALALAVWAWHHGDGDTLRDVLTASGRDWFGWFRCPSCHGETAVEDQGEGGYCLDCDAAIDDDDQDRDDLDEPRTISATITYDDGDEPVSVLFGVIPTGYEGSTEDLPGDWRVFYWLDEQWAARLAPGFGMGDGWTVVTIDDDPMPGDDHALPHDDTPSVRGWWEDR